VIGARETDRPSPADKTGANDCDSAHLCSRIRSSFSAGQKRKLCSQVRALEVGRSDHAYAFLRVLTAPPWSVLHLSCVDDLFYSQQHATHSELAFQSAGRARDRHP
jgi:hypothetical protein